MLEVPQVFLCLMCKREAGCKPENLKQRETDMFLLLHSLFLSPLLFPSAAEEMLLSRHKDGGHAVLHSHSPQLHPPFSVCERAGPLRWSYLKESDEAIIALYALLTDGTETHCSLLLLLLVFIPEHNKN